MPTRRSSVPAHDALSTEIGERVAAHVRQLRKAKGWTQREPAARAEVNITLATITKIADALHCDPSVLLEPTTESAKKKGAT